MIRYPITFNGLTTEIERESNGWLFRAAVRTATFRKQKTYDERTSIWSEIKAVYMRLQGGSKCAYCERKLESVALGKGEQDVEHFRPKGNVVAWKCPKALTDLGVTFTKVPIGKAGYYLLAYHPFNYAASCKPCNSALKKNYFPIAGRYNLLAEYPPSLSSERSYILYPIGNVDNDPEQIIEFYGPSPRPVAKKGHKRNRALVTIHFFKLDDVIERKNLYRERAMIILAMYPQLVHASRGRLVSRALIQRVVDSSAPHANCARSFRRLFDANRTEARDVFKKAVNVIVSMS